MEIKSMETYQREWKSFIESSNAEMNECFKRNIHQYDYEINKMIKNEIEKFDLDSYIDKKQLQKAKEVFEKLEITISKLPNEIQEKFWDITMDSEIFQIAINPHITEEEKIERIKDFFDTVEHDSAWLQIRKLLYPIVHERLAPTIALQGIYIAAAIKSECSEEIPLLLMIATICFVVDCQGQPEEDVTDEQTDDKNSEV